MLKLKIRPSGRSIALRYVAIAFVLLVAVHFYLSSPVNIQQYRTSWRGGLATDTSRKGHTNYNKNNHNSNGNSKSNSDDADDNYKSYDKNYTDACGVTSGLERVVITVKTGATEAAQKVPTTLRTTLRCAPNVLVFSDMAQQVGDIKIYDALDRIPSTVKEGNADFDLYRKQQELGDPEKIVSVLGDFHNPRAPGELAAWSLDKYKNIHIVEKTWAIQPDMDWYLHVDADTYVLWSSLIAFVQTLDPSKESFLGSVAYVGDKPFAHGGSGILLSNGATRKLTVAHNGTAAHWDPIVHDNCCGDSVLAQAFKEMDVGVQNVWPTINGESPDTIPFAEDHWCQPVVTLHHVASSDAERVLKFEEQREDKNAPVIYAELYKDLISGTIPESRIDWDNMSGDEIVENVNSADNCTQACAENTACFQSVYDGAECKLGTSSFRLGEKRAPGSNRVSHSSWNVTRIEAWAAKQKPCTKVVFPST